MGECGCGSVSECFKLKAPDGWYIIELMPGCSYCCISPGLLIHHPESINPMFFGYDKIEDMESLPDLPVVGKGEDCISLIKCGLSPDEASDAAIECFAGTELENNKIDKVIAEILGGDFWMEALSKSPSMICIQEDKEYKNDQS